MSAASMTNGQLAMSDPRAALHGRGGVPPGAFGMGLQLLRASTMATTRLQLALIRGDRRQAMDAMDWLLDIDAEMECLVSDPSFSPADDPDWQAITIHLADQKAAIAWEKHALAGGVIGSEAEPSPELADRGESDRQAMPAAGTLMALEPSRRGLNAWLLAFLLLTILGALAGLGMMLS